MPSEGRQYRKAALPDAGIRRDADSKRAARSGRANVPQPPVRELRAQLAVAHEREVPDPRSFDEFLHQRGSAAPREVVPRVEELGGISCVDRRAGRANAAARHVFLRAARLEHHWILQHTRVLARLRIARHLDCARRVDAERSREADRLALVERACHHVVRRQNEPGGGREDGVPVAR